MSGDSAYGTRGVLLILDVKEFPWTGGLPLEKDGLASARDKTGFLKEELCTDEHVHFATSTMISEEKTKSLRIRQYRSAITNPATLGPGGCRIIHFSGLLID